MNSSTTPSTHTGIRLAAEESSMSVSGMQPYPMKRTRSQLAQVTFSLVNKLEFLAHHRRNPARIFARIARRLTTPFARSLGPGHLVSARLYGLDLLMPAEHALAATLAVFPTYNRPLALVAQAVSECAAKDPSLVVIDVGANIGDTVAIIEQVCPHVSHYLCIEADREIAELCRINHFGNPRVQVEQCFIGEDEGIPVFLEDDGHANATVRVLSGGDASLSGGCDRIIGLDTAAASFMKAHGTLSLIKVDTEGYDFSVLRSGSQLLRQYLPNLYFEWFPKLLTASRQGVWDGFEYLASLGYRYYVLFTNQGNYYCSIKDPDRSLINALACVTHHHKSVGYFDVFASQDKIICQRVEELAIREMGSH